MFHVLLFRVGGFAVSTFCVEAGENAQHLAGLPRMPRAAVGFAGTA
jgi:hypothetical protein